MWHFRKADPADGLGGARFIAFVGGGGKTSLMEDIAEKHVALGRRVAITTTTRILAVPPYILLSEEGVDRHWHERFVRVGDRREAGKLTDLSFDQILHLGMSYDLVLVEADGAKRMPLKFPAAHEPVVPPFSEKVFVVAGLDALGGRVAEKVFRWELLNKATGTEGSALITPALFARFFREDALLRGVSRERAVAVLNKYDTVSGRGDMLQVARLIVGTCALQRVYLGSAHMGLFYEVTKE